MIGHVLHSVVQAKWFIPTTASIGAIASLTTLGFALRRQRSKPATIEAEVKEINLDDLTPGDELGSGQYGTVQLFTRDDKQYVVKSFKERKVERDEEFTRGLKLRGHPSFVQMYASVEHMGEFKIVMEYIDGATLGSNTVDITQLDGNQVVRQLLEGYAYALDQEVIPLDVHFDNLMFDKAGHLKYIDLGLYFDSETQELPCADDAIKCVGEFWTLVEQFADNFELDRLRNAISEIREEHRLKAEQEPSNLIEISKKPIQAALALLTEETRQADQ